MKHYVVYDKTTGRILLSIKASGRVPESDDLLEITQREREENDPIEERLRVNLETKKLERKSGGRLNPA